jgi:hypothetical protein
MTVDDTGLDGNGRTRTMRVPRTRGAVSGLLLVLLGAWGALVPFIGPYFDYSWGTDQTWVWSAARGWLEVLPGAVTAVGGWLVLISRNRASGSLGGWLAALAGAWFVIGQSLAQLWHIGDLGGPLSTRDSGRAVAQLGYFYGLGAVIIFLAAFALGRLAVVGVRDLRAARRDDERAAEQARVAELERQRIVDEEVRNRQAAEAAAAEQTRADEPVAERRADERAVDERAVDERAVGERAVGERTADRTGEERTAAYPTVDERAPQAGPGSYDPNDGRHAPAHSADLPADRTDEPNPYDPRA